MMMEMVSSLHLHFVTYVCYVPFATGSDEDAASLYFHAGKDQCKVLYDSSINLRLYHCETSCYIGHAGEDRDLHGVFPSNSFAAKEPDTRQTGEECDRDG